MNNKILLLIVAGLLIAACDSEAKITSFEGCVAAGNPVMESYPEQCRAGENTFINNMQTLNVATQTQECEGVGSQQCLIVNDQLFYENIQGFEHEEGFEYTLKVRVEEREDVPADASKFNYELVEIISKERAQQACTREYRPVCGEVEIQCVTTPCDPLQTTFSNACEAENAGAEILYEGACVEEEVNLEGACLSFDGKWLEDSQECEGMASNQCEELGGTHNECASACRNDPDAQICTLQCVQVCQFK